MSSASSNGILVSLEKPDMWSQFHPNTEMVVTKKGRKLYPELDYVIEGLVPDALYTIAIYLERADNFRYTFSDANGWDGSFAGGPKLPIVRVQNPKGGRAGSDWMEETVSFSNIRITNDPDCETKVKNVDLILVQSMHKFLPVVVVKRLSDGVEEEFRLQMTEFYAVTVYQSSQILDLKKANNKFASGFLPNGKHFEKKNRAAKRPASSPNRAFPSPPLTVSPDSSGTLSPDTVASSTPMSQWGQANFQNGMIPPTPAIYPIWNPFQGWTPFPVGIAPTYPMMTQNFSAGNNFEQFGMMGSQSNGPQYTGPLDPVKNDSNANDNNGIILGANFNFQPF